jgi:hypothetical protein
LFDQLFYLRFSLARSVSLHLAQAQFRFTSLAGLKINTSPTLFILVAYLSQALSSVAKPNTRKAALGLNIGTQEMIEPKQEKRY